MAFAQSPFHSGLEKGPYAVGYEVLRFKDLFREYGTNPRPINVSIWYPAQQGNHPVLFKNYLHTEALVHMNANELEAQTAVIDQLKQRAIRNGAAEEELDRLLKLSTLATKDATQLSGNWPFVLVIQGGGRPAYTQFILNELLASHGYLVASISDIREHPERNKNTALGNALALSQDIDFVLQKLAIPEHSPKAIVGFSKAGESILHHQATKVSFNAMIFLDAQPNETMVTPLKLEKLAMDRTPSLAFFSNHQGKMNHEQAQADSTAFQFLGGDILKMRLMEANHGDLTSSGILGDIIPGYNRWPAFGNSRLSHETLCRISLHFLNQYLKKLPSEQQVLQLTNELPTHFISMHRLNRKQ